MGEYKQIVTDHYISNWGDCFEEKVWQKGPLRVLASDFRVMKFKPRASRQMWTYATNGMSSFEIAVPIELHIFSSVQDDSIVELLAAVCHYHRTGNPLDLNHTVNFGRPWQKNSKSSYGLISLPYLDGPGLENLDSEKAGSLHFYWLIPVTKEEVEFKKQFGIEDLEARFEERKFNYLAPERESVV